MSEKFDLPFESNLVPKMLELGSSLKFRCHKGISCFNACCKKADITLTPYDVIRLKDRLGKSSADFLKEHTVPFRMDKDGLPGAKLKTTDEGVCNFMNDEGCSVYSDRPTACRYYPLGHMSMLSTGAKTDETHYFLVQEDHCKGHQEDHEQNIAGYLKEQETAQYDEMNREWLQLMLKRRSMGPTVGRPPEATLQMFFMCSYDMDRFRRFVLSENFRRTYELGASAYEVFERQDLSLMQFGVRFMRQAFFGERTIPEREGAWEERVKNRQEVWEARRRAEISRQQQAEDEKYKEV
ncbi:MAG: YkgJ family cysteine cluster protein [Gammaproteobacteria bacterium]|nr:YkgJ family cysteine cluster protein [Gammaproteobacteria bacterium]MCP5405919.1 YkgJ family cysteine cluster protein [Chromatiaceae bacterium]MCP5442475.1 YkgJ family cysteine cluster protein [Chromatiaceae bacterium]